MTPAYRSTLLVGLVSLAFCNITFAAAADGTTTLPATGFSTSVELSGTPPLNTDESTTPSPFVAGGEIDSDRLSHLRGGSDLVANDQKLEGTVATNVATNVVTGANSIASGALANVNGIPIVIQNSGANVLIQNATIINLHMQ